VFVDARQLPRDALIECDLCIVGAGAAGITIARELIDHSVRVCLLESGGLAPDSRTQSLYKGQNVGLPYLPLHRSRFRFFGGSTNNWTGWCRPLNRPDFERRDWIPHSGWPFDRPHLDPYYERAQQICQLGPYSYDLDDWENELRGCFVFPGRYLLTEIFQFSPPTLFGKTYRDPIERAPNVQTYLNANVLEFEMGDRSETVKTLVAATLDGNKFKVCSKVFVLAAGAIENARLLLLSIKCHKAGLGNQNDLVGRFFMEHPYCFCGVLKPSKSCPSLWLYTLHNTETPGRFRKMLGALSPREEFLKSEKFTSGAIYFAHRPRHKTLAQYNSLSAVSLARLKDALQHRYWPEYFLVQARNISSGLDDLAKLFLSKAAELVRPASELAIRAFLEPAPNLESRLTLSRERDRLGMPRIRLNWKLAEIDWKSFQGMLEILRDEFSRGGLGRIDIRVDTSKAGWPAGLTGGSHHMGTTRMHRDPAQGVVDSDCRVHETTNLFVAGSSVFPTAGHSNPTLTIIALAIRLADHLKRNPGGFFG